MTDQKPPDLPPIGMMADLPDDVRVRLAAEGEFVTRSRGAYLTLQGRPHHAMSFILSGKVAVSAHANEQTVNLAVLSRGDVVGEMSIVDPRLASASVRVVSDEPAELWVIDGEAFNKVVEADPAAGFVIMKALGKVLCDRLRKDSERMLRRAAEMRDRYLDMDY
ncbi:MAG: cyclic nucleotide-binding domain-containing protein [Verrucomicrobiota bacterium]